MLALRTLGARLDDADRMYAQFGFQVPIVATCALSFEPVAQGREHRVIEAKHLIRITHG